MASRFSAKFSFASKLCRPWLLCVAGCSLRNLVTTSHRTSEQCCSYWFADSDFWRNISNEMCSTSRWRILTSNTKPNLQRDNIFCQCLANCDILLWLQLILNSPGIVSDSEILQPHAVEVHVQNYTIHGIVTGLMSRTFARE